MKKKPILHIDMDGTIVDFMSGVNKISPEERASYGDDVDDIPGVFALMDPIPGVVETILRLTQSFDCYILTTAPWGNPSAWSDKLNWVKEHLGDAFRKRVCITHHKNLLHGDFLVDDRPAHGAEEFEGEWLRIGSERFPDWGSIESYLLSKV